MSLRQALTTVVFRMVQLLRKLNRQRLQRRHGQGVIDYGSWLARYAPLVATPEATTAVRLGVIVRQSPSLAAESLSTTLCSLQTQTLPLFRAWIVDDADASALGGLYGEDTRMVQTPPDTQLPDELDWVMELQAGDQLAPHGLALLLAHANAHGPGAAFVYGDHDHVNAQGHLSHPRFKPDWDPDLHLATGYAASACLVRRAELGRISLGEIDTDRLLLAQCRPSSPARASICHAPGVVLHRSTSALQARGKARLDRVQQILPMLSEGAEASVLPAQRGLRIHWPSPPVWPLVSLVIPTRNQLYLLRKCVESVLARTDYPNLQLIVVDNQSDDQATLVYLEQLGRVPKCHVLRDDSPFNYSALNNRAVRELARGSVIALLNNDVEAIEPDWLKEMVSQAVRPDVGCVGARLLYSDRSIQHGGVILGISKNWQKQVGIAAHAFKSLSTEDPGYMGRAQVAQSFSAVTAACLVIRRELFDLVGGLDETHLAVAYNDVDFCLRVKEAGYRNIWTPHATLYHHESISRGKDTSSKHIERFTAEADYMRQRWGTWLANDPAYNPNLSLERATFELSCPPRTAQPWAEVQP